MFLNVDTFFKYHSCPHTHLQHVRDIWVEAAIAAARYNWCAYHFIFRTMGLSQQGGPSSHRDLLDDLSEQVHLVLSQLKLPPSHLSTCQ